MEVLDWFFIHRSEHPLTMESLYQSVGISRQGFHQYRKHKQHAEHRLDAVLDKVQDYRQDHPRMGARPLYQLLCANPQDGCLVDHLGRDQFERALIDNGLGVEPIRIFYRTTYPGAFRFANLCEGMQIRDINRIWVSDLTYYRLLDGWAYLTFILDLYSRRCLGYALGQTMQAAQTTIKALKMALKQRAISNFKQQLIFHSDGGGQYIHKQFLRLIDQHGMQSSMAQSVYENPHIERFHSTAKNQYLIPWGVNSISKLEKALPRFIKIYNEVRPHRSLGGATPLAFEKDIQQIPISQRTVEVFKKVT